MPKNFQAFGRMKEGLKSSKMCEGGGQWKKLKVMLHFFYEHPKAGFNLATDN